MVQFFFFKAILRHFLLSATTDVKDGHGLKLIKLGQLFSISTGMLQAAKKKNKNKQKNTQCLLMKFALHVFGVSYGTFCLWVSAQSNDFGTEHRPKKPQYVILVT